MMAHLPGVIDLNDREVEVVRCPTWGNSILMGLKELYTTSDMFDVELVENSGQSLWAHSCVLAAACPNMKNAFAQTTGTSPRRIFYADIGLDRWKQLLDFIYLGQVSVTPQTLPPLMTTAQNLGMVQLVAACQDSLDRLSLRQQHIVSVTPRKRGPGALGGKTPHSLSTKKRNMLERIPLEQQRSFLQEIEQAKQGSGDANKKSPKSTKVKKESEGDDDEDLGEDDDTENSKARMYKCSICNKDLPYGSSLFRHELRHKMFPKKKKPKTGSFECEKCPKTFSTKNARNCHQRNHNKQPKYSCQHCDKKTFFQFIMDKHLVDAHPELEPDLVATQIPCSVEKCTKKFHSEALLKTHKSRKHGIKEEPTKPDKPVPCDICDKPVLYMAEHKKAVHPEEVGEARGHHPCPAPDCGKVMKYASSLKRHMYVHGEGGPVFCPHCKKDFNHPSSMWSHIPSCPDIPEAERAMLKANGSGTKKYKRKPKHLVCETCNRSFTNLRNYKNHIDTHNNIWKHQCTHCGKKFQNTNHFKDHINRHYGNKPYTCETCGHPFASKSDMKQHQRQHTGEKPFRCPICKRDFVHRSNCYAHARKAHNKEIANDAEMAKMCKVDSSNVSAEPLELEQDDGGLDSQHVVVLADATEDKIMDTNEQQVQIAELILQSQQQQKAGETQQLHTIDGQTYTTIQADNATGGSLNTVLVPQYVYNPYQHQVAGVNVTGVNGEFHQQQQQHHQHRPQDAESKFLYFNS